MKHKILTLAFIFATLPLWITAYSPGPLDCTSYFTWEQLPGFNSTIQFHNQSTGEFSTWMWDFGDGTTSGEYNPMHAFSETGIYYVCLTISDDINCYDVYCDTVVVQQQCQADFEITYVPTTPTYVQFTDLSTGYPDAWLWDFGDGTSSTEQHPVHPYYDPGTYNVCLIIEHADSLYTCSDSICKTVIIPDSLDCEATFNYSIDEENPLMVHYYDASTGNITDWEWDFGDGTISNERNPVHTYSQPSEYLVCLKVENSDTSQTCLHFICETIVLEDSIHCEAEFIAVADSASNVMYKYNFYDMSSGNPDGWLWKFGDGNISHEQDPVHVYDDAGTYEICLTTWNSNYPGCSDSYCMLIQTADYFQLGGLAFIGENPINNPYPSGDTGIAILYRQQSNQGVVAVDTNEFHELGYYWFSNMMELNYMIRISLSPGSDHYEDFIPSYFPGVMGWQEADIFTLNDDMYEMNTSLWEVQHVGPGPGILRGRVVSGDRQGVEIHSSFHEVPVILADQNSTPLEWTVTDEYGGFEFTGIALGSYLLHADVAGIWSQPESVIITEEFPLNDTILIEMYNASPFGLEEPDAAVQMYSLYPNPVINNLTLQLSARKPLLLSMNIINMTGQSVYHGERIIEEGLDNIVIPVNNLSPGLYMMSINWDGQRQHLIKKFIKN